MGLGVVELIIEVENAFEISITDHEVSQVRTVEDLFLVVLNRSTTADVATDDLYCRSCGYNLRGCESRQCPECGLTFVPYPFEHDDELANRTWTKLLDIISEQLGVPREKLKPTTRFVKDLRAG